MCQIRSVFLTVQRRVPTWSQLGKANMMTKDQSLQLLLNLVEQVKTAETDDFFALSQIAGLNPLRDFSEANLSGI
ncbi:MAG: hypothetical protein C4287_02755, partial [Leptolyngbya sp. ERB_1_2]